MQSAKARFEKQGIRLAAISYDSEAILKYFAGRHGVEFPLLADPDSKVIRVYETVNTEANGRDAGMSRPGYFFIDAKGIIREKFFEAKYRERLSGNDVIATLFPELGEEVTNTVEAPHLRVAVQQSDRTTFPGNRIRLTVEVRLPEDVHVYSPGVRGYRPTRLTIEPAPDIELLPVAYPASQTLYLPAIKETVPVFEGTFRVTQEAQLRTSAEFINSLGKEGKTVTIHGQLDYQACDQHICFLPASAPVEWELRVLPLDRQRAPENIQHKAPAQLGAIHN